jgi:hypothetical protein
MSSVLDPLLQIKVYGENDPLGVRFIVPLFSPQVVLVTAEEIDTAVDPVTVIDEVAVHVLILVTVTL